MSILNNIFIPEEEYNFLLNRIEFKTLEVGLLIFGICIYIIYRTIKVTKLELNSEYPICPPIRTLVFGLILIVIEIVTIFIEGGAINFGEVKSILDIIKLLFYLIGYFIMLITGVILVISFVKRENHYRKNK